MIFSAIQFLTFSFILFKHYSLLNNFSFDIFYFLQTNFQKWKWNQYYFQSVDWNQNNFNSLIWQIEFLRGRRWPSSCWDKSISPARKILCRWISSTCRSSLGLAWWPRPKPTNRLLPSTWPTLFLYFFLVQKLQVVTVIMGSLVLIYSNCKREKFEIAKF